MTDQYRDQKNSVQRGDLPMLATGGGAALFLIPAYDQMGPYRPAPYDLPPDLAGRDQWLRQSPKLETMWANAVGIATTKMAAWQWDVESSVPIRAKRARELLLHADGGGWVRFVSKIGRDYLTTSNGMFIEIERFGKGYGSRIKALHHLDSARCRRTGDPEIPVVYTSLDGREHEMRYWQVLAFSDMPETAAEKLGIGFPAAQRAWHTIAKMAQMERYVWESVSGRTPTKLHFVGNAHLSEVEQAVTVADAKANKQLWAAYQGAVIVGSVAADQPVSLVSVPLKEMPEHFNPEQERKVSYLHYAAAIGL
ncbi:MAG: hypothetical protein KDD73_17165, partial [Anaerolineales bacterium]|nr:hypothetical protein [Anaerolineales bacterium]